MNEAMLVAGMALVTLLTRYPLLALARHISLPDNVFRALRYVPSAVLSAIIMPAILFKDNLLVISPGNGYLVAGIVASLVAWRTRNLLLTIIVGMAVSLVWRLVQAAWIGVL